MENIFDKIQQKNAQRGTNILKAFGEGEAFEKGKKGNIGEIRDWGGKKYKKQGNGKWMEVSESHGKTSKEHREEAEKIIDNGGFAAGAEGHIKHAEKLSDKEHDESELEEDKVTDEQRATIQRRMRSKLNEDKF